MPNVTNKSTISDIEVSKSDIIKALNSLNPNKSPGPDEIHPLLLKNLAVPLAYPLMLIFNKTLSQGKIPSIWKVAEVVPIFKKGSKCDPGNYRPVSLTSIVCKVFEGFIRNAIYNHLISNKLLSDHQFGFCSGRSCVTNLLVTLNNWIHKLDNNIPLDAFYLDFSKAFDTVPHKRLINKLSAYGIQGNLLRWIEDFLSDRSQYVKINNNMSSLLNVSSGVPQGSVLGPVLFIYFINDLPNLSLCPTKIFADDTKLYNEVQSEQDQLILQNSINNMFSWTKVWLLKFNKSKCKVLHLGKNNPNFEYYIGEGTEKIKLLPDNSEKDLGVYVDPQLNFEIHINETIKKCRSKSAMILKNITFKTSEILIPLFKAVIRPILEYANVVWSPQKRKHIDKLEKIQRNFTKCIIGLKDLDYEQRLTKLKLPSLEFRRVRGDLIETYKLIHQLYDPKSTNDLLSLVPEDSITRTHNHKLYKKRVNTNLAKYFFTNRIVNVWNNLPADIVCAENLNKFKNKIDYLYKDIMYKTNLDLF